LTKTISVGWPLTSVVATVVVKPTDPDLVVVVLIGFGREVGTFTKTISVG